MDERLFAFFFLFAEGIAAIFEVSEGLQVAISSGETTVEELDEWDFDVKPSDCERLAKVGDAKEEWWW